MNAEWVFNKANIYSSDMSNWFKRASSVESAFRWLIKIGVLRREVDGQGLTSKIRLTPLGRQILEENPDLTSEKAGFAEHLGLCLSRYMPFQ